MNVSKGEIQIFSGNAHRGLAENICKELGVPFGCCEVGRFSDGEIFVNIDETVRGRDVFLIQPTCTPVNDNLMEALILIDAFKRASAGRINAVIPYYGYARQDRKTKSREPITAKLAADLFEVAGIDRLISMDLHAGQIQGYFDIPVDHLSGVPILADYFRDIVDRETVIVSPDLGGVTRTRNFANLLDLPIAIIEKRRPKANVAEVMNIIGDVEGKNVVLVDDIVDTAGTITKAAQVLKDFGAKSVYACATHPVLSGPAVERIEESVIEEFVITDSIPLTENKKIDKIKVVTVAPIFAEAIKRIHSNKSVSTLFD